MGRISSAARLVSPVNRATVALWAWQHRDEIAGWAGYASRAVPKLLAGEAADVLAEGRLRARLTADARTRSVRGLDISVVDGVAHLRGEVDLEAADVARDLALDTIGVRRVRDELRTRRRRSRR